MLTVKFKNLSPNLPPAYSDEGSSGMDIRAWMDTKLQLNPGERALVHTGIYANIPMGYELQVRSRSGLTLKKGLIVANSPGTIDSSYTGEIGIIIYNISNTIQQIESGERIAQLVLAKVEHANMEIVNSIEVDPNNTRKDGGFGHTGTN